MYITVGRKDIVVGPRGRLAFASVVVLIVHFFIFWGIASMRALPYNLPDQEDKAPPVEVEVYDQIPPPPPIPRHVVEPVPPVVPPKVEPKPVPQPQPQPQQAAAPPQTPQPQPVPEPPAAAPSLAIKTQPMQKVDVQAEQARQMSDTTLAQSNVDMPTLAPEPSKTRTKKRSDADSGIQGPASDVKSLTALNLHQASGSTATLTAKVAPSGLAAPSGGPGSPSGGGPAGGGALANFNGGQGMIGKGRGSLTQALQNHEYCNTAVAKGKSPPPNCNASGLSGETGLGLVDRPDLKKAAAQRDANLQYKTGSGNAAYWQRVSGSPSTGVQPNFRPDDHEPGAGAYSDPKDQRVMSGGGDSKSGN